MSNEVLIKLEGRIDSSNAAQTEEKIMKQLEGKKDVSVILDAQDLDYISSAGLRIILRIRKTYNQLSIQNVNSDVYEILEMTGFTDMMEVKKAYRAVSIEGCEEIGRGAVGIIYRIDKDNVVKVYQYANALESIQHEREVAKLALILGIPTAISYDVVRVGDSYGSVFELLNATSFSKILAEQPEKMDWCVKEYTDLLKKIHSTVVPEGKLPSMKERTVNWAKETRNYLPEEAGDKLLRMVEEIPEDNHMIHGDYHTKNVELQGDEVLLIDMDTLAVGYPILEFSGMYNSFRGYGEVNQKVVEKFHNFSFETAQEFWQKVLRAYLGTTNENVIREFENKARILSYTRLIRHNYKHHLTDTEQGKAEVELWTKELMELLEVTDTLCFHLNELVVDAQKEKLPEVIAFIEEHLEKTDCSPKEEMQITMAAEEIFVNISSYAYKPEDGKATIQVEISEDPVIVTLTFMDNGKPYDPLAKEDPNVKASLDEREIGGLGIFLVKKTMDDVSYEYKEGKNILKLKKNIK